MVAPDLKAGFGKLDRKQRVEMRPPLQLQMTTRLHRTHLCITQAIPRLLRYYRCVNEKKNKRTPDTTVKRRWDVSKLRGETGIKL